jgi:hypothetical protein
MIKKMQLLQPARHLMKESREQEPKHYISERVSRPGTGLCAYLILLAVHMKMGIGMNRIEGTLEMVWYRCSFSCSRFFQVSG